MSAAQNGTGDRGDRARRAAAFQEGAEDYDRLRPGYPPELWHRLLADLAARRAAPVPGAGASTEAPVRAIDVGAGTGRATLPLAEAGARVLAVDPSRSMLDRLMRNAERAGLTDRIAAHEAAFENLDPARDGGADLVVLAQSLHWTDPAGRWERIASLLAPTGLAALVWNGWHLDPARHDVDAVASLFEQVNEGLACPMSSDVERREPDGSPWTAGGVVEGPGSGAVTEVGRCVLTWYWEMSTDRYLALPGTTSQYRVAEPAVRGRLEAGLSGILGESVLLDAQTLMVEVARA